MDSDSKDAAGDRLERDVRNVTARYYARGGEGNEPLRAEPVGLVGPADPGLSDEQKERRRVVLVDRAVNQGMSEDLAELLYDVALEEGIDPPLALELVLTDLSVMPQTGDTAPEAPVADRYLPTWIFPEDDPRRLRRERALRMTFRRLRGFLETDNDVEKAFRKLAAEPDVGYFGY